MKKNNVFSFLLMHAGFVLYSFYSVTGKVAAKYDFLSLQSCFFYGLMILILGFYAINWQIVLKSFPLFFASTNKAITIIWGMLWGKLFFSEDFTPRKIIAVLLILTGIFILNICKSKEVENE